MGSFRIPRLGAYVGAHVFVFFLHALGLALISKWLDRQVGASTTPHRTDGALLFVPAVAVFSIYPSAYEILYWPTCMPYTLGAVLLALGLWTTPSGPRIALFALSFLTLESFVLPALALLVAPAVVRESARDRWRNSVHPVAIWSAALGATLAVRWIASIKLGSYQHATIFTLSQVVGRWGSTFRELFHVRFFADGTNDIATAAQYLLLIGTVWLAWQRIRWSGSWLLTLCFLSTATYWVLGYDAPRALYGSQVMFLAVLVWLVLRAGSNVWARRIVLCGLVLVFAGYLHQSFFIYEIKSHNARVVKAREAEFAASISECVSPCVIEFRPLDEGLRWDWVLPPEYWATFLEYMRTKYGPEKTITFELRRENAHG